MKKFFAVAALVLFAFQAQADSFRLDSEPLRDCGGYVSLNESLNGDLALKFTRTYCENVTIKDGSSGRVIAQYNMRKNGNTAPYTASYTLSAHMRGQLERDLELDFVVSGYGNRDDLSVIIPGRSNRGGDSRNGGHNRRNTTGYGRTNSGKCAYYIYGDFQRHAPEYECYIRGI